MMKTSLSGLVLTYLLLLAGWLAGWQTSQHFVSGLALQA
jgi:hypothetical protein